MKISSTLTLVPGQEYRRRDLHRELGGQERGGISTPAQFPYVLLFTGEPGAQYGYEDGFRKSGTFEYTGEGQIGDMDMQRGNLAIRDHVSQKKRLLLFEIVKKRLVRFLGEAAYLGHQERILPDKNGTPRRAFVFELSVERSGLGAPAKGVARPEPLESEGLYELDIDELRDLAVIGATKSVPAKDRRMKIRQRSEAIAVYAKRRAKGICEGCGQPAPFVNRQGRPYLEPHHIRSLADGGPDDPRWVAALCPNCHRRVHYAKDGDRFNQEIAESLSDHF